MELEIFLNLFFDKLHNNKIQYGILRNYDTLPYHNTSNDIDLLISRKSLKTVIEILYEMKDIYIVQICKRTYVTNVYIYNIKDDSKNSLQLDFVYNLQWKGIKYLEVDDVLKNTIVHKNFYVVSKYYEALILYWSKYVFHNSIKDNYISLIKSTLNQNNSLFYKDLSELFSTTQSRYLIPSIVDFTASTQVIKNQFIISKLTKKGISSVIGLFKHYFKEFFLRYSTTLKYLLVITPKEDINKVLCDLKNTSSQFIQLNATSTLKILLYFYLKPISVSTTFIIRNEKPIRLINKQYFLLNKNEILNYIKIRSKQQVKNLSANCN